ncbi:olfactory receptor 52M1-like [Pelodiscus sinensis]|uniref:olfactory receptor 52M1-like n=1 Tax=Pelodiscus sinensis TaxID=13735 RepID=UPI003F6C9DBE
MCIITLLGNFTILCIIKMELSLHGPMYYFLCMLAMTDLGLSTSILPKTLSMFCFNSREIHFSACLTQMFFIHFFIATESGIFVAMAVDRYVAICHPLRHSTILTSTTVTKLVVAGVLHVFYIPGLFFSLSGRFDKKKPHPVQILIINMYYVMPPMLNPIIYGDFSSNHLRRGRATGSQENIQYILEALFYLTVQPILLYPMSDSNTTKVINPSTFILLGICGLETAHVWISIPFCIMYIITLLGNITILCIVKVELSLHGPMYYFLCTLAKTDFVFYIPGLFFSLSGRFDKKKPPPVQVLINHMYYVMPPMLNPIIYGVRTKQIWDRMLHFFSHKGT